ncbi:hypothetical protein ARALYDRAFT_315955 [Arabidopsis lyrata subsp. lyrata]|uniref:Methyltransferase type 11 domain-containing protein n=1 Tax=Arabidopsis lyrata subsp. lyrata TaxID=81972 RepID=D7KX23_ARALL|nr:hypothetical protein ARALYDRAFT_315955 [Arabidopsis lyrata subsp. lyrata]
MYDLRPRTLTFLEVAIPPPTDTTQCSVFEGCSGSTSSAEAGGILGGSTREIEACKVKVFDKLSEKAERVLEIGIGSGPNMRYYAARNSNVTLYGLDPNPKMKKYARKSATKAGLKPKNFRFKQGVGEAIPLKDNSVDAVVATLVLCSVSDVTQTLKEIKRVLRPGGVFIFLEHVAAKDGSFFKRLQKLLDPLQQRLADGCHLTRNTRECILEAGFSGVEVETYSILCPCGRRHFLGDATTTTPFLPIPPSHAAQSNSSEDLERLRPPNSKARLISDYKMKLFDNLVGKAEKVLEIGIGTGPNFKYYTAIPNLSVIGIDPNARMESYARKSAEEAGLKPEDFTFIHALGESIPLEDASVDAVVGTLVLCSVADVTRTLNEIKRVLRPGGTFIFIEHVAAEDGTFLRLVQNVLDPLQQVVADGCHLTRHTGESILEARFNGGADVKKASLSSSFIAFLTYSPRRVIRASRDQLHAQTVKSHHLPSGSSYTSLCSCGRKHFLEAASPTMPFLPIYSPNASRSKDVSETFHPQRPDWYKELFAWFLSTGMRSYEAEIADYKRKLFEKLAGKAETVLEIGVGTGLNLKYFAGNENVCVFGMDPNHKMEKYAFDTAREAGMKPENFRFIQGVGEAIPLDDDSMDAVVATLVLCSVSDVTQTLNGKLHKPLRDLTGQYPFNRLSFSEIKRVLKPDGSFFRHVQNVLDPIQQVVADGCHLTRNTDLYISDAGFDGGSEINNTAIYSFPWIIRPHVYGAAYK